MKQPNRNTQADNCVKDNDTMKTKTGRWPAMSGIGQRLRGAFAALALLALPMMAQAQSDATLAYLFPSVGTLTPDFAPATYDYTASVPFGTTDLIVYALPMDSLATLTINGSPVNYGDPSPSISLSIGDNVITNTVVSQDTTVTNTYLLTVTRSSLADLTSLVLSSGTLAPTFSSSTLNYNANAPYGTNIMNAPFAITVTPTAEDGGATITVNGSPVTSGSPSDPINLNVGINVIAVVVTGTNASVRTYTINVARAGPVGNPGMEARAAVEAQADGLDQFSRPASETWRQYQRTGNGGAFRIWNPGKPGCFRQPTGTFGEGFGGDPAEGDYCMALRSVNSDGLNYTTNFLTGQTNYFEAIGQLLPVNFEPNMTYIMTVKVGRPAGDSAYAVNWLGYAIQLCVGGVNVGNATDFTPSVTGGQVIAEYVDTASPPIDGWVTAKLKYTPDPANDGLAGVPLQVRLCTLDNPTNLTATGLACFDDVRLQGEIIPPGDVTAPTLTGSNMVDDKGGDSIPAKTMVTYTVTFNETMDASTVIAAGFTNAGTAPVVMGKINQALGGVFTVQVTPTSAGTLRLAVPAGANMRDISGNPLNTASAIPDNTTITVGSEFVADGTWVLNTTDFWNNSVNWSNNIVANGTDRSAFFTADINPFNTIALNAPRTIGNITFTDRVASHDLQLSGTSPLTLDRTSGKPDINVSQAVPRQLTLAGPITGNDGLSKSGPGILRARINDTFTGDITINGGRLHTHLGVGTNYSNISIASGAFLYHDWDDRRQRSLLALSGVISGAGGLLKGGTTGLILNNDNTYTGVTTITPGGGAGNNVGGVLLLNRANALPGGIGATGGISPLTFSATSGTGGATLGLGAGDFTRPLAAAGVTNGVNFSGNGGWSAYGADRLVNLGGAAAPIVWADANTGFNGKVLIFGNTAITTFQTVSPCIIPSTHKVTLQNPLDLGAANRTVTVQDGLAAVDAELSGVLSSTGGGLTKNDIGQLALSGANTYTGPTTVSAGTLYINGDQRLASGAVSVAANATLGGTGVIGGDTTIAANGRLAFNLSTAPASHDKLELAAGKTLTFTGASVLTLTPSGGASTGTYVLLTAPGGISGVAPATVNLPTGWTANPPTIVDTTNLVLNVTTVPAPVAPTLVSFGPWSGGSFPLTFSGPNGQSYKVLSSTNVVLPLASWTMLTTGTFGASPVTFTDGSATNAQQFYRIQSP